MQFQIPNKKNFKGERRMKNLISELLRDEEGQGMVEYGIIIALLSIVALVAIKSIGGKVGKAYTDADKTIGANLGTK